MDEYISRYLEQEMTAEEQASFEQKLEEDPQLEQELEEEVRARAAIAASAYLDRKARLMARGLAEESSARPLLGRPMIWAVAAVVAILIAFWGIQQVNRPLSNEDLFAQYYQAVPFQSGVRGSEEDLFEAAGNAYQAKDFSRASQELEKLLQDSNFSLRPKALYFLGLSYVERNELDKAHEAFKQVPSGSVYGPAAQWYMALVLLKSEKREEAKKALQRVLEGPVQSYQAQAKVLLQSLDQ